METPYAGTTHQAAIRGLSGLGGNGGLDGGNGAQIRPPQPRPISPWDSAYDEVRHTQACLDKTIEELAGRLDQAGVLRPIKDVQAGESSVRDANVSLSPIVSKMATISEGHRRAILLMTLIIDRLDI